MVKTFESFNVLLAASLSCLNTLQQHPSMKRRLYILLVHSSASNQHKDASGPFSRSQTLRRHQADQSHLPVNKHPSSCLWCPRHLRRLRRSHRVNHQIQQFKVKTIACKKLFSAKRIVERVNIKNIRKTNEKNEKIFIFLKRKNYLP